VCAPCEATRRVVVGVGVCDSVPGVLCSPRRVERAAFRRTRWPSRADCSTVTTSRPDERRPPERPGGPAESWPSYG
jgi:hypothetical protein